MNQAELRLLADERVRDAEALIQGKRWSFAYYAAGYAVECALKSCLLARMIYTGLVYQPRFKADECRTHDFIELIRLADMNDLLNKNLYDSAALGSPFVNYWDIVKKWKSDDRYVEKTEPEATDLLRAIIDPQDGVLPWIKRYW